jgi:pyruvate dehydrogenase (quinone)
MANAMPNALGIALAYPGRQVIAICGDGGLAVLMGELLTIAERKLPVKLVVLNNGGLEFVNIEMEEAGIEPFGIKFENPDFRQARRGDRHHRHPTRATRRRQRKRHPAAVHPGAGAARRGRGSPRPEPPPHITFGEAEGFSLSLAKQALHGNLDEVIETIKRNIRIV